MIDIREETYQGWHMEVGVEQHVGGAFSGQYFIAQQTIRHPHNQTRANVPFDTHVGGPYLTPALAFAKGFEDCKQVIDRMIEQNAPRN